jgi:hypothetical protein
LIHHARDYVVVGEVGHPTGARPDRRAAMGAGKELWRWYIIAGRRLLASGMTHEIHVTDTFTNIEMCRKMVKGLQMADVESWFVLQGYYACAQAQRDLPRMPTFVKCTEFFVSESLFVVDSYSCCWSHI